MGLGAGGGAGRSVDPEETDAREPALPSRSHRRSYRYDQSSFTARIVKITLREGGSKNPKTESVMLHYAIIFLVIAIIALILGFGGIAGTSAWIAHILFVVFLVLFIISLIFRGRPSV